MSNGHGIHAADSDLDMAIIGGGAAGLSAAVFAKRTAPRARVAVFEKAPRVGRKLLATGNGTCNLSNVGADVSRYHGGAPDFAAPALAAFSPEEVCRFFASIGVDCVTRPDGRIYPLCGQAAAVLDCLRLEGAALGAEERTGCGVSAVTKTGGLFLLDFDGPGGQSERLTARRVLLCTGGAASPGLGGSREAYGPGERLGHRLTRLAPSIVQITTDPTFVRSLKGVRADARLSLERGGKTLAAAFDEVLFTDYGLSGPAALQVSRHAAPGVTARLDLLPDMEAAALEANLRERARRSGRSMGDLLTGLLHKRLGQTVLRAGGFPPLSEPASALDEEGVRRLAAFLRGWPISVTGTRGLADAQVTAGGLDTADFDPHTLQSRLVPGLYAAGEVLDIDGDCGGFNLQWAWASARAAAEAAVRSL